MIKKMIFGTAVVCSAIAYSHSSKSDVSISKLISEKQIECLTSNVYHEARGESIAGQLAVALVTNNRKNDIRFPNTYCDVVKEGPVRESWKTRKLKDIPASDRIYYPVKHKCQFSWYCDGKSDKVYNEDLWKTAYMVASAVAMAQHIIMLITFRQTGLKDIIVLLRSVNTYFIEQEDETR
jgi:hypothetical protein